MGIFSQFAHRIEISCICMHVCCWNKMSKFSTILANGHIMLNTSVLVRSLKLSNIEPSQYLDGWPPGNTGCCWLSFFSWFKTIFAFFGRIRVIMYTLALFLVLVHVEIHGNWSKFEENLFSRGFVILFESFRKFLRCFKMFRFCRTGTPGIDRTLSYGAKVSAGNFQKSSKIRQKIIKIH